MNNRTAMRLREDLRNGMTIEDALTKYKVTFKEACEKLKYNETYKPGERRHRKPKIESNTPAEYIQERNGSYYLRKCVDKKTRTFGTYSSLEDAVAMREALKKIGWKQRKVDELCKELGITRCEARVTKKRVRYH